MISILENTLPNMADRFASELARSFCRRNRVRCAGPEWRPGIGSDQTVRRVSKRKPRKPLSAAQRYEMFVAVLTGQTTQREAADKYGVDRSTVVSACRTAKQGALGALAAAVPGRRGRPATRDTCAGCPVSAECLSAALAADDEAEWRGGVSPEERRHLWQALEQAFVTLRDRDFMHLDRLVDGRGVA